MEDSRSQTDEYHPLLMAAKDCCSVKRINRELFELLDLQEIEHVACYVVTESGKLLVQEKKFNAIFGKVPPRWQSFGGCNFRNSVLRMLNSLRLELADESAILLTNETLLRSSPLLIRCSSQPTLLQVFLVKDRVVNSAWSAERARSALGSEVVPAEAGLSGNVRDSVRKAGDCVIAVTMEEARSYSHWRSCDLESFNMLQGVIAELQAGPMKPDLLLLPRREERSPVDTDTMEKLKRIRDLFNSMTQLRDFSVSPWVPMLWSEASFWFQQEKIKRFLNK